jgi:hypothetical protein
LTVWLTDDKYKMPVLMKSQVVIGHVSAVLKEFSLADKAGSASDLSIRRD